MEKKPRIMGVFLKYGHGLKKLGDSFEKENYEKTLRKLSSEYKAFYYDEYLDKLEMLQAALIESAKKFKPDMIFFTIIKDELTTSTLDSLKKDHTTINIAYDDQWRFDTFSKYYGKHFSYVVTFDKDAVKKYRENGQKNAIFEVIAMSDIRKDVQDKSKEKNKDKGYLYDVSFIGGKNKIRSELNDYLNNNGINVKFFGRGWENGQITSKKMNDIMFISKINLNLSNSSGRKIMYVIMRNILNVIHSNVITDYIFGRLYILYNIILSNRYFSNHELREKYNKKIHDPKTFFRIRTAIKIEEQIKFRHFEIPAQGGFQLSYHDKDIEHFFKDKEEIAFFKDRKDLIKKIEYYLKNDKERERIKINGYQKVVKEYQNIKTFKRIIDKIYDKT